MSLQTLMTRLEQSVRTLLRQRGSTPGGLVMLGTKGGEVLTFPVTFDNLRDKDLLVLMIYDMINEGVLDEIVLAYELWFRAFDPADETAIERAHSKGVRSFQDKKEGWMFYYESRSGEKSVRLYEMARKGKHSASLTNMLHNYAGPEVERFIQPGRFSHFFQQAPSFIPTINQCKRMIDDFKRRN